jgi:hypothetical protein
MNLHKFLGYQEKHSKVASSMPASERARLCRLVACASLGLSADQAALAGGGAGQGARALAHSPAVAQVPSPPSPWSESRVASLGPITSEQLVAVLQKAMPERYYD